ncbi:MAG: fructose-1,6-bisphosphatase [Lachnospiraceae bacterium]|jgi:fructose-1,6-bisphosphatase-3|nr:fructose-1,6-bisphosphatase [Lachnospiraceae bacterium]MCI1726127.1 fructose-1,6-bisphosphatase [Lachnospiraceae bacterium]
MAKTDLKYLECLAEIYPTIASASTEIINLSSILNLPKGTEHFITDIHGEYEAFSHVLKNGSGSVRKKIDEVYGRTLSEEDTKELATLIYYPHEKIDLVKLAKNEAEMNDWYKIMLYRLIAICKHSSSKYTRSKVRKALPKDFAYVIEELITEKSDVQDKEDYYEEIVNTIIRTGRADVFIIALSELIQRLVVDHLHILGDIYDRGSGADDIMDKLETYHSLDIQWGNHDIVWMGAAAGQTACIANVVRICARYGNLDMLEDGYGINLLPLASFADRVYKHDPCTCFALKGCTQDDMSSEETRLNVKMHKAISIIQFKLEGELIARRKQFGMESRRLLHLIDYQKGTIMLDGKCYELADRNFPTIDPADPYRLTEGEQNVVDRLQGAFRHCERLQRHMRLLLNKGSLYKVCNGNLLYHGCMPLDRNGLFKDVEIYGDQYKGKALYDVLDSYVRQAFFSVDPIVKERGKDILWWIWCNEDSPLFGKHRMATFERYFLKEPETHEEIKNPYYSLLDDEKVIDSILKEFGLEGAHSHIINGHVPVQAKKGESPMKCGGKVLVIDGGFSKAYQGETGIAGYTLIFNSWGMMLVAHEPFTSTEEAIRKGSDIHSDRTIVEQMPRRLKVGDTDNGRQLKERISELEELLEAYRSGRIVEKMR